MYTAGAKKDLRNIFRYISEELLHPENAAGQTERIMTAIRKLDTIPNRNRLYEEEPWYSRGLRFFPVNNYLVFYKTDDETETVYVVRIMYGGRDVHKQLQALTHQTCGRSSRRTISAFRRTLGSISWVQLSVALLFMMFTSTLNCPRSQSVYQITKNLYGKRVNLNLSRFGWHFCGCAVL